MVTVSCCCNVESVQQETHESLKAINFSKKTNTQTTNNRWGWVADCAPTGLQVYWTDSSDFAGRTFTLTHRPQWYQIWIHLHYPICCTFLHNWKRCKGVGYSWWWLKASNRAKGLRLTLRDCLWTKGITKEWKWLWISFYFKCASWAQCKAFTLDLDYRLHPPHFDFLRQNKKHKDNRLSLSLQLRIHSVFTWEESCCCSAWQDCWQDMGCLSFGARSRNFWGPIVKTWSGDYVRFKVLRRPGGSMGALRLS